MLQYAARRVWVSRLLLIALPILLVLSGMAVSESNVMRRDYPRASAGQEAPVRLTLLRDTPHPATAYLIRAKQVQVSIPLQVSGVAEGYALIDGAVKVTVDAANGAHWTSPWQARQQPALSSRHERILDQRPDEPGVLRSGEIDAGHASFHSRAHTGAGRQCEEHSTAGAGLFRARFRHLLAPGRLVPSSILRNRLQVCPAPTEAYVHQRASGRTVRAQHRSLDPNTGVQGDAWIGSLENSPADFGIAPVWSPPIGLSNGTKWKAVSLSPGTCVRERRDVYPIQPGGTDSVRLHHPGFPFSKLSARQGFNHRSDGH